eukprot:scaffold255701_cov17-Prasinocladus_malaysianus.AAC.1
MRACLLYNDQRATSPQIISEEDLCRLPCRQARGRAPGAPAAAGPPPSRRGPHARASPRLPAENARSETTRVKPSHFVPTLTPYLLGA